MPETDLFLKSETPGQNGFINIDTFLLYLNFFYKHSRIAELQAKRQDLSLTPLCHSHPLHRHLDIHSPADYYWELAFAYSYQPDLNWETLVSERKPLITKLRVLWCSPVEGLANNWRTHFYSFITLFKAEKN